MPFDTDFQIEAKSKSSRQTQKLPATNRHRDPLLEAFFIGSFKKIQTQQESVSRPVFRHKASVMQWHDDLATD